MGEHGERVTLSGYGVCVCVCVCVRGGCCGELGECNEWGDTGGTACGDWRSWGVTDRRWVAVYGDLLVSR